MPVEDKSPACRQEGESVEDCVSRKVPELLEENPDWDEDQAVAAAHDICETPCSEKSLNEEPNTKDEVIMSKNLVQKRIGVPLVEKSITENEDGSLSVRGYFTSDQKDQMGDIITKEATEQAIPSYREWGNIRYMHQPEPVARVDRIGSGDGLEWNEVEITVLDEKAKQQVENGLLKALSVGIMVDFDAIDFDDDGGWVINEYTLAEISLVDHPANYDARLILDDNKSVSVGSSLRGQIANHGFSTVVEKVLGGEVERDLTDSASVEEVAEETPEREVELVEGEEEEADVEASLEPETEEAAPEGEVEAELTDELEAEEEVEKEASLADELNEMVEAEEESETEEVEEEKSLDPEEAAPEEATPVEEELDTDSDISDEETLEEVNREVLSSFAKTLIKELQDAGALPRAEEAAPEEVAAPEAEEAEEQEEFTEIEALRSMVTDLTTEVDALKSEIAELQRPARRKGKVPADGTLPHDADEETLEEEVNEGGPLSRARAKYGEDEDNSKVSFVARTR